MVVGAYCRRITVIMDRAWVFGRMGAWPRRDRAGPSFAYPNWGLWLRRKGGLHDRDRFSALYCREPDTIMNGLGVSAGAGSRPGVATRAGRARTAVSRSCR